jgi:hypothetical protein
MNARYLSDSSVDGYFPTRSDRKIPVRRGRFDLRPLFESVGWVLAGASIGCTVVMLGAWGLMRVTEPHPAAAPVVTAMSYQLPASPGSQ